MNYESKTIPAFNDAPVPVKAKEPNVAMRLVETHGLLLRIETCLDILFNYVVGEGEKKIGPSDPKSLVGNVEDNQYLTEDVLARIVKLGQILGCEL